MTNTYKFHLLFSFFISPKKKSSIFFLLIVQLCNQFAKKLNDSKIYQTMKLAVYVDGKRRIVIKLRACLVDCNRRCNVIVIPMV